MSETPLIEEHDLPGILGTRDGMRLAYGILWATWSDKNTAASMARHLLLTQLTKKDQAIGIGWARKVLQLDKSLDQAAERCYKD